MKKLFLFLLISGSLSLFSSELDELMICDELEKAHALICSMLKDRTSYCEDVDTLQYNDYTGKQKLCLFDIITHNITTKGQKDITYDDLIEFEGCKADSLKPWLKKMFPA